MAKGKGKSKKSKPSKGDDDDLPAFHCGVSGFAFPNGDSYEGGFCAHRTGLLWREGRGVYTTHDGQTYEGEWKNDRLIEGEIVRITYPDGSSYEGRLSKGKYSGGGTYTLPNGLIVTGDFSENRPKGEVTLIDFDDRLWRGCAKADEEDTLLMPENHFYLDVDEQRGKGEPKGKARVVKEEEEEEESVVGEEEEEREEDAFAKSEKTRESLHFIDSQWYKRYEGFKTKEVEIRGKLGEGASLDEKEVKWLKKCESYRKRRKERLEKRNERKSEPAVQERGEAPRTVKVFYPSTPPEPEEIHERKQDEEETEDNVEKIYEDFKRRKEEKERAWRFKYVTLARASREEENEVEAYDIKTDETKNPNCSCGKRVCQCRLSCV